ncbi:uncharacterized protein V6R79_020369 [Siganus canaliculatus]
MEVASFCLMLCLIPAAARLDISPNSAQFFKYTEISLKCVEASSGWTVTRNTSRRTSQTGFGTQVSGLILEVPALPVMEGDNVTLRCSYREKGEEGSSSGFSAAFYQDQVFKGNEPAGVKTLSPVTKDHEGLYKCQHSTFGDSPESFLTVTAVQVPDQTSPDPGPGPDPSVVDLP